MLQLQSEKCLRGGGAARLRDMSDEPHEILRDTQRKNHGDSRATFASIVGIACGRSDASASATM